MTKNDRLKSLVRAHQAAHPGMPYRTAREAVIAANDAARQARTPDAGIDVFDAESGDALDPNSAPTSRIDQAALARQNRRSRIFPIEDPRIDPRELHRASDVYPAAASGANASGANASGERHRTLIDKNP